MSYEFSQETRQMILEEPYCAKCGRNANAILSIHHINGRTSNSVFNGICLCFKCHDTVKMSKHEQIKFIKSTWESIQRNHPDYKLTENDLDFFKIMAKRWGMELTNFMILI